VDEYKPRTPVPASFLPFPMNVNAPQPSPAQQALNYISFETSPKVHRRRATLPSMVLSPADAAVLQKMWSNPDLQPIASSSPSKSTNPSMPSPPIGVAVTSGSNPKRRSRSAGALYEMARTQAETTGLRRRSSEIRFWRTSRVDSQDVRRPKSRPSSDSISPRASTAISDTELSDALADTGSSVRGGPKSFDFGSITTETNTAERHVQIVEQRLSQLEFNMQHISLSLQELAAPRPDKPTVTLDKAPTGHQRKPSLPLERPGLPANPKDVFTTQTTSKRSTQISRPPTTPSLPSSPTKLFQHTSTYLSSPSTASASPSAVFSSSQPQMQRPSTSAATPQPTLSSISPVLHQHLAPLYHALRYERTVRKALEDQVLQLRQDVLELNAIVSQLRGATIPTPSPDRVMAGSSVSAEKSRFSGYDSDDDDGKGFINTEKWATPKEELVPPGWGQSSEELAEGEMF
jgi:hypothetical protein